MEIDIRSPMNADATGYVVQVTGGDTGRNSTEQGGRMCHLNCTASEVAEQQLEALIIVAANGGQDRSGEDTAASVTEVLVMAEDQRPYLVRRLVDRDRSGAQLCWVSVSTAGWAGQLCHPVVRIAVIAEPRPEINAPTTPAGATLWRDLNERR